MRSKNQSGVRVIGVVKQPQKGLIRTVQIGWMKMRAFDPSGVLIREDELAHNLVTNAGLTYITGTSYISVTQITTWFVGLTDGTPTLAAADTMASHAGWVEVQAYTEATREAWTGVAGAAGVATNAASVASFAINSDSTTIGGVFMNSIGTKGGTTGTLVSEAAFSGGDIVLNNGATLEITYEVSSADDGV